MRFTADLKTGLFILGACNLQVIDSTRGLLVSDSILDVSQHAYAVTLQYCQSDPRTSTTLSCFSFCNGSFIAPNVVLTSGNCIHDTVLNGPPVPLSNLFVLVGSSDSISPSSGSAFVGVSQLINGGYGANARFPLDDNIGLVILDQCLDSSKVAFVKVATLSTESVSTCGSVGLIASGIASDLPIDVLLVNDGQFRYMNSVIHSTDVCQAEYASQVLSQQRIAESDISADVLLLLKSTIISDSFICSGGDTVESTCFGDSGGAVLANTKSGDLQLVGITSILPSGFCSLGADFSTRVAPYAFWISAQLDNLTTKCDVNTSDAFASWPVPEYTSDMYSATRLASRCFSGQFQCVSDGMCIDGNLRCDGKADCQDQSDENSSICSPPAASSRRLERGLASCTDSCQSEQSAVSSGIVSVQQSGGAAESMTVLLNACESLDKCDSQCTFPNSNTCRMVQDWANLDTKRVDYANDFNAKYAITCDPGNSSDSPNSSGKNGDGGVISGEKDSIQTTPTAAMLIVVFIINALIAN